MSKVIDLWEDSGHLAFWCPGCETHHAYDHRWKFNGNFTKPTFHPSLMINKGCQDQCHLNVTDGKIIFHGDCHHKLKGQTVEMRPVDLEDRYS